MNLHDLVEASDIAGLLRHVDLRVKDRDWAEVLETGIRCRAAIERGKQLGGVTQYVEYRMALDAPAPLAASVVEEGGGRSTLGPLWEVMASTHTWEDLEPWLEPGRVRMMVAHERSLRGDDVADEEADGSPLVTPLAVEEWEPTYPPAEYRPDGADFPTPPAVALTALQLGQDSDVMDDVESEDALFELVRPWVDQSNGAAGIACIEGTAEAAITALGASAAEGSDVQFDVALSHMTWAAASGGAYGTRRGNPVGRSHAWYAASTLLDIDPAELPVAHQSARWLLWRSPGQTSGWEFGLAAEHGGFAWALYAHDRIDDDSETGAHHDGATGS